MRSHHARELRRLLAAGVMAIAAGGAETRSRQRRQDRGNRPVGRLQPSVLLGLLGKLQQQRRRGEFARGRLLLIRAG
jgi:hypothetical protein